MNGDPDLESARRRSAKTAWRVTGFALVVLILVLAALLVGIIVILYEVGKTWS